MQAACCCASSLLLCALLLSLVCHTCPVNIGDENQYRSYFGPTVGSIPQRASLESMTVNPEALTVTSFNYNPTYKQPDWVDRILGGRSVFYDEKTGGAQMGKQQTMDQIKERHFQMDRNFKLEKHFIWPPCSMELLGYVRIGKEAFLKMEYKYRFPITGEATLRLSPPPSPKKNDLKPVEWKCVYRAVFENWRTETFMTEPNFWAVMFYCAAPNGTKSCEEVDTLLENIPSRRLMGTLSMQLRDTVWNNSFVTNVLRKKEIVARIKAHAHPNPLAVCLAMPYSSSNAEKQKANWALLLEWIRYYTMLGARILIYDRDGTNHKGIFDMEDPYARKQGIEVDLRNVIYYNYTIRGLLDPSRKNIKYDNVERNGGDNKEIKARFESQGHDKVLTLTHCRFEAKAMLGVEDVLVTDADEFIYCPQGGATFTGQARFIHSFIQQQKLSGVEQLTLPQRVAFNKTANPALCMQEHVSAKRSVFECFGGYGHYIGGHSIKSFHFGHYCPLTGYHNSCAQDSQPRSYNCHCVNKEVNQNPWYPYEHVPNMECAALHFVLNQQTLQEKWLIYGKNYNPERRKMAVESQNEFDAMTSRYLWFRQHRNGTETSRLPQGPQGGPDTPVSAQHHNLSHAPQWQHRLNRAPMSKQHRTHAS